MYSEPNKLYNGTKSILAAVNGAAINTRSLVVIVVIGLSARNHEESYVIDGTIFIIRQRVKFLRACWR